MVQFNLLPDVKLQYIKAQRMRSLVITASIFVTGGAVALLILMLVFVGIQNKHLKDLSADIVKESKTLQQKKNIDTVLTVQNQLKSLTALHDAKPAASRLFTYLNSVTPSAVTLNSLQIDFTAKTISISGSTNTLKDVNQYVDTLKLTTYVTSESDAPKPAFSNVVLSSFGISSAGKTNSQPASFTITFSYDEAIFLNTQEVTLSVPTITTHAQLQTPNNVFSTGTGN